MKSLLCTLSLLLLAQTAFAGRIVIDDIRVNTSQSNSSSAYMLLINYDQEKPVSLTNASSPNVSRITIMKKRKVVSAVTVRPAKAVEMKPNSYYLQLDGIDTPLQRGDILPLLLTFDNGDSYTVDAIAVKPGTHHHHDENGDSVSHHDH